MTSFKVTARKVCNNPESWAGLWWHGKEPHCCGMDYASCKEAKQAARTPPVRGRRSRTVNALVGLLVSRCGKEAMEHIVRFEGGYDCILFECTHGSKDCKPGSGGSHGRHGLSIRFVSKGDAGAVQFLLYTGWTPQHASPSSIGVRDVRDWGGQHMMPADLGYHSKTPRYDGQEMINKACEFCGDQPCYYDGSGLNANDAMYALVNGGDVALWTFLDAYYDTTFKDGPYPTPAEFKTAPRKASAHPHGRAPARTVQGVVGSLDSET